MTDVAIASVTLDGQLRGGVVYRDFTGEGGSVCMHMAGFLPRWAHRDFLWVVFYYPFEQMKVKKIWAQVPASNLRAMEIDLKLGFRQEQPIRDVYPDGDMNLLSMYRADCRFLSIKPRTIESRSHGR